MREKRNNVGSASSRARRIGQSVRTGAEGALHHRQFKRGLYGLILGLGFATGLAPASARVPCETIEHRGARHIVCTVDLDEHDLRLFLNADDGAPIGSFQTLREGLEPAGFALAFGMNGGMYHRDRSPVGLYVEDGREAKGVVTSDGPGNFHLLPNGVFAWGPDGALVRETRAFAADPPSLRYATQSGPMLVIDGALHPRFLADGSSEKIRNGVGVKADGKTVVFAISRDRVNFHDFGTLFRDVLDTPNALYLDGTISSLYSPTAKRADGFWPMGPIIAVVEPIDQSAPKDGGG